MSTSPSPGTEVASTKSTSPPVTLTASPVATPGTAVRSAASRQNFCRPRASRTPSRSTSTGGVDLVRDDPRRGLPQDRAELALELADAGLAGVLRDHRLEHRVGDRDLVLLQARPLALARPEVPARDRDLLVGRVAVEADDLHPVEQRPGDRLGDVGRREEEDLREVDLDVEVVVAERRVLRRIEHLEERRRRVAAPVGADLVDLVEQDHRVHRLRVAERPHEAAREARRCTCGGGRGSRPRHARRRATCGRTRGSGPSRPTRRSTSCRCRAARSA